MITTHRKEAQVNEGRLISAHERRAQLKAWLKANARTPGLREERARYRADLEYIESTIWVLEHPEDKRPIRHREQPHGTYARYINPRIKCRCDLCRAARAAYIREWRARANGSHSLEAAPAEHVDVLRAAGMTWKKWRPPPGAPSTRLCV